MRNQVNKNLTTLELNVFTTHVQLYYIFSWEYIAFKNIRPHLKFIIFYCNNLLVVRGTPIQLKYAPHIQLWSMYFDLMQVAQELF
jgi:hypothetical protein